ncbi:MAG: ATP-binding protein [Planctomycetota bacterium]
MSNADLPHFSSFTSSRLRLRVRIALFIALVGGLATSMLGVMGTPLPPLAEAVLGGGVAAAVLVGCMSFKQFERGAELQRRRLQTLVEETDICLWEFDPGESRFLYVSPQIERFGHTLERWYEKDAFPQLIHEEDREWVLDHCASATAANQDHSMTYRMLQADGSSVWIRDLVRISKRPGRTPLLRGVFVDVSDSKEIELENERLRIAAESSSQTKGEFLANVSHEIRTPLTAILGYTQMLLDDEQLLADTATAAGHLRIVDTAGQHLLTLINDVLDLSKIEADKMDIEEIEMDLRDLLEGALGLIRHRVEAKSVALDYEIRTPLPRRIKSDPTRLRQVLINLLGNAAKFTDAGGVRLIASIPEEGELRLEVEDSGRGMSPEESIELFQPFSQADGTVTRRFGGTGLGLTISRRLAILMGGTVELVRTEPGVGTSFGIRIPLREVEGTETFSTLESEETRQDGSAAVQDRGGPWSPTVLLVEDGLVNQKLIATILKRAGADVTVAENGLRALDRLEELAESGPRNDEGGSFDLIVSDMQMPEMDGYALARELRARGDKTPILALTAHAMEEDRLKCIQAGCTDFATKPIDRKTFLDACRRLTQSFGAGSKKAA